MTTAPQFASDNWSGLCPEALDYLIRANAGSAQALDRHCNLLRRLHASDQPLHLGRDILHAKACARQAHASQRINHARIERARIKLGGDFRLGLEREMLTQRHAKRDQPIRPQRGWRAAAQMQSGHTSMRGQHCRQ